MAVHRQEYKIIQSAENASQYHSITRSNEHVEEIWACRGGRQRFTEFQRFPIEMFDIES